MTSVSEVFQNSGEKLQAALFSASVETALSTQPSTLFRAQQIEPFVECQFYEIVAGLRASKDGLWRNWVIFLPGGNRSFRRQALFMGKRSSRYLARNSRWTLVYAAFLADDLEVTASHPFVHIKEL